MKLITLSILLLLTAISMLAQEPEVFKSEYTEQQLQIQATKEAFKASLTEEQRQLLNDDLLSKEQKREAFRASLSANQKNMLQENKKAIHQNKNLRKNLSNEQKLELKNDIKKKRERIKRVVRRTRLNSINN